MPPHCGNLAGLPQAATRGAARVEEAREAAAEEEEEEAGPRPPPILVLCVTNHALDQVLVQAVGLEG